MVTENIDIVGTFTDEISARVQGALDTFVEFGSSQERVAEAFTRINQASKIGARGLAQTSNALRKLMDETESADLALKGLEQSFELAERAGLKVEDAAAEVGRALKGQTDVLSNFDAEAKRVASAIDRIADPAERARLTIDELNRAMVRQERRSKGFRSAIARADVTLSRFGVSVKSLSVGFLGLIGTSVGAGILGAKTALDEYTAGSKKMIAGNKRISKSINDLKFTLGSLVAQAFGLSDGFKGANKQIISLTKSLVNNRVPIVKTMRDIGDAGLTVFRAVTMPLKGFALLLAMVQDGFTEVARLSTKLAQGLLEIFVLSAEFKQQTIGLSNIELKNLNNAKQAIKQIKATSKKVKFFSETQKLTAQFEEGERFLDKLSAILKNPIKVVEIETRDTTKPAKDIKPTPTDDILSLAPFPDNESSFNQTIDSLTTPGVGELFSERITKQKSLVDVMKLAKTESKELGDSLKGTGQIFDDFANKSMGLMVGALDGLIVSLAKGGTSFKDFGKGLLIAFADLTSQTGQALVLLSLGVGKIKTGDFTGALGVGLGLIAFGAALKGFASRTTSGATGDTGDGSTARALERFGRRLFERDDPNASREVVINIDGRQMRVLF